MARNYIRDCVIDVTGRTTVASKCVIAIRLPQSLIDPLCLGRGPHVAFSATLVSPLRSAKWRTLANGGGPLSGTFLNVPGLDVYSLRSLVGSRLFGSGVARDWGSVSPEMRLLWLHEFLETSTGFNTFLSEDGGNTNFAVNGLGLGRDWAVTGVGLNWEFGGGWSSYADYDLLANDQERMHLGSGGVQFCW